MLTPEQYRAAVKYLARVKAVARQAGQYLPRDRLVDVHRLIERTEPAEGMCDLAWVIVTEGVHVPAHLIDSIYQLTGELIRDEDMPANLREYAMGEDML